MTPYLSADWFGLWKAALDEAKRLDVNIWIYDENSYPSGFAGGYVPEAMPESRGRGLHFREEKRPGKAGPDVVGVFRLAGDEATNVTEQAKSSEPLPDGNYLTAVVVRANDSPWFAGRCYVDLLYPGVTEKFLEVTLEPYRRQFGDEFGKHIPGVFTDEPKNAEGHPFYSAGVAYVEEFDVPTRAGRYLVELPDWFGSVAKVHVNGELAGYIGWRPWECDVTDRIRPGRNQVEVVVMGTLRNVLGPHHAGPPQGIVTPQSFIQAPPSGPPSGRQYSTVGYGLFRPFVIRNITAE
jgi:hypothetical protein